jgi:tRNA dimethylallyltransferase
MSEPVDAVCLMGPTASGKTALALALCRHYPCEIISVDSALVYRGMDIGTAKPGPEELAAAPHHLIDIRDPAEPYSAADFRADALRLMAEIRARGRLPLLVGGTMLYFKVLTEGIAELPAADAAVRAELAEQARREGWPALHRELERVDPEAAARIHPNHSQRIQRALEVYRLAGVPMSELHRRAQQVAPPRLLSLALAPAERALLHQRIALRFEQMLAQGFIDEVARLRARGDLHPELPSIRAVGYRQVWSYLDGECDYAGMMEQGIAATRQLAKRQFTWLRQWSDLRWLLTDSEQRVIDEPLSPGIEKGAPVLELALKYLQQASI